jgi:hypothetical protein
MGAEVHVESWADLRRLPQVMDEIGEQLDEVVTHARTWVARRDGFEPSPVCLLRPLAEAMGLVEAAFAGLGREFGEQWGAVRAGVVAAERELAEADAAAVAASTVLASALRGVA